MKKIKIGAFVEIIWRDAWSVSDWFSETQMMRKFKNYQAVCVDRGWLMHSGRDGYGLAASKGSMDEEDSEMTYGNISFIPRPWVQNIKEIKV